MVRIVRRSYSLAELYEFRVHLLRLLLSFRRMLNYALVEVSAFLKLSRNLGLPVHVNIEVTGDCHLKCVKCAMLSEDYKDDGLIDSRRNMSLDSFRRIIDDIGGTLITLRLWHYGEPLLNKDVFSMIEYAKLKGITVVMSSTLSPMTTETADRLAASGLDYLLVSLDAASEETYREVMGKDHFQRAVANLRALLEAKRRRGSPFPFIELQFVVMRGNESEMGEVKDLAARLGIDKLTYIRLNPNGIAYKELGISLEQLLPKNPAYRLDLSAINRIDFCRIPWDGPVIRYSGLVLPCVNDTAQKHPLGRLFDNGSYAGFRTIWNNEAYRAFRRRLSSAINEVDICNGCTQKNGNCMDQIQPS